MDWRVVHFTKNTPSEVELRLPDVWKDGKKLATGTTGGPRRVGNLGGMTFGDANEGVMEWAEIVSISDAGIEFAIGFTPRPALAKGLTNQASAKQP